LIGKISFGKFGPWDAAKTDIVKKAVTNAILRAVSKTDCMNMFGGIDAMPGLLGKISFDNANKVRDALVPEDEYEKAMAEDFGFSPDHGSAGRIYLVDRPYGGVQTLLGSIPGFFNLTESAQMFTILHELLHIADPTAEGQNRVDRSSFGHSELAKNCDVKDPSDGSSQWVPR
jgi:hypothetical protein